MLYSCERRTNETRSHNLIELPPKYICKKKRKRPTGFTKLFDIV